MADGSVGGNGGAVSRDILVDSAIGSCCLFFFFLIIWMFLKLQMTKSIPERGAGRRVRRLTDGSGVAFLLSYDRIDIIQLGLMTDFINGGT